MSRPPLPEVTDHAVLRHLERARGVDVEAARREVARMVARGAEKGAVGVLINGLRYVLRGGRVVTVLDGPRSQTAEVRNEARNREPRHDG